jgi:hypothetical protein
MSAEKNNICNLLDSIDIYGTVGTAILPSVLRAKWAEVLLPEKLASQFGLRPGSTIVDLEKRFLSGHGIHQPVWTNNDFIAALNYCIRFTDSRRQEIKDLYTTQENFPHILTPSQITWSTRTRNYLARANLLTQQAELTNLRFRDLFDTIGMGAKSVLEFTVTLEKVITIVTGINKDKTKLEPKGEHKMVSDKHIKLHERPDNQNQDTHPQSIQFNELTESLDLSVRSTNCLRSVGIDTIGDLVTKSESSLMKIPNMGKRSLNEIIEKLSSLNLHLGLDLNEFNRLDISQKAPSSDYKELEPLLQTLENASGNPWIDQICHLDPRFRDLLPFTITLGDAIDNILTAFSLDEITGEDIQSARTISTNIPIISDRISAIDKEHLESVLDTLFAHITGIRDEHRRNALMLRMGWGGQPAITLEEAGELIGVTRERIRQIQNKAYKRLDKLSNGCKIYLPQLDKAIDVLEKSSPLTEDEAASLLSKNGISQEPFHPASVLAIAETLGYENDLQFKRAPHAKVCTGLLTKGSDIPNLRPIIADARRMAGASGVANLREILIRCGIDADEDSYLGIRKILSIPTSSIKFLSSDWFWIPSIPQERNRLRNVCIRMLSVTAPLSVYDLRKGVRRHYTWRSSTSRKYSSKGSTSLRLPSKEILHRFFEDHPEFNIDQDGQVTPSHALDYREELGETERTMVEVLRTNPSGVLDRQSFRKECISREVNSNTFEVYTSFSPVINHVGPNIWSVCGADINPCAVEALRVANLQRPKMKRLQDFGWTKNGNIWLAIRLSDNVGNTVVGCPSGLLRFTESSDFTAYGENDIECGTIKNSRGTLYGFGPYLRMAGADEDDVLRAEFNIQTGTVSLSLISEDILD